MVIWRNVYDLGLLLMAGIKSADFNSIKRHKPRNIFTLVHHNYKHGKKELWHRHSKKVTRTYINIEYRKSNNVS